MKKTDKSVTLTYGTFSCSLQGFDDRFEVLQPIAGHFRDLWAHAHESGDEIPAPDADDLARIAGDVIAHPVEGYEAQGVIVLRLVAAAADTDAMVGNVDEIHDQEGVTANPAKGGKSLSDVAGDSRQPPEETVAEKPVPLTENDKEALKAQDINAELLDDNPGQELAQGDDSPKEGAGEEGNNFDVEVEGIERPDSDAEERETPEKAPTPVVRPSRVASVIKIKRSDFDAAVNGGLIEEYPEEPDDAATQSGEAEPAQGLSPESEADLQQQLAAAGEVSDGPEDVVIPTKPQKAPARKSKTPRRKSKSKAPPRKGKGKAPRRKGADRLGSSEKSSDLERIFEKTDSQMGKSDTSARRSALQHLRAAVAATRAEKSAGHELDRNADELPYRSDLAEVVDTPPANMDEKIQAKRKKIGILSPLKLISRQRADSDKS